MEVGGAYVQLLFWKGRRLFINAVNCQMTQGEVRKYTQETSGRCEGQGAVTRLWIYDIFKTPHSLCYSPRSWQSKDIHST